MAADIEQDMKIGELDQLVTLQSLAETNDEGDLTQAWTTVATVFAKVKSERGTEAFESARVNARETIRVMMRYRSDVTTKWRIEWMSQFYSVTAIDRSGHRKGELWVTAQLVGAL